MKKNYKLSFILFILFTFILSNILNAKCFNYDSIDEFTLLSPDTNKLFTKPIDNIKTTSNNNINAKNNVDIINNTKLNNESTNEKPQIQSKEKVVYISASVNCTNCPNEIKKQLSYVKGIKGINIDIEKGLLIILYDSTKTNEQTILKEVLKHNMGGEIVNPPNQN